MAINRLVPYLFLNLDSPIRRLVKLSWLGVIVSCCSWDSLTLISIFLEANPVESRVAGDRGRRICCLLGAGNGVVALVSAAVKGLLPEWANGELAAACSWSDAVRLQMSSSGSLHFADTHGDCKFSYANRWWTLYEYCSKKFNPAGHRRTDRYGLLGVLRVRIISK